MAEGSPEWLKTNPQRYLDYLKNSPDPKQQEAARLLQGVVRDDAPYDAMVVMSRPKGKGGYGKGVDDSAAAIKDGRPGGEPGHHRRAAAVADGLDVHPRALEADREKAAAEAADYPNKVDNQQLGRALRWLDYDAAAVREAFRGGAAAMKANVFDKGRSQNAAGWREYGHLLRGAGEDEAAPASTSSARSTSSATSNRSARRSCATCSGSHPERLPTGRCGSRR